MVSISYLIYGQYSPAPIQARLIYGQYLTDVLHQYRHGSSTVSISQMSCTSTGTAHLRSVSHRRPAPVQARLIYGQYLTDVLHQYRHGSSTVSISQTSCTSTGTAHLRSVSHRRPAPVQARLIYGQYLTDVLHQYRHGLTMVESYSTRAHATTKSVQWHRIISSLTLAPLAVTPLTNVHSFHQVFILNRWILVTNDYNYD